MDLRKRVLLAAQGALLGVVTPNLRGVTLAWTPELIAYRVIFFDEPSEEELDDLDVAATEIIAHFSDKRLSTEFVTTREPLTKYSLEAWAYRRKEPRLWA